MRLERLKSAKKTEPDSKNTGSPAICPAIAVVGVGNTLFKDDGLGIHALTELAGIIDPAKVDLIDGGTVPDIFTLISGNVEKLIIIDAADAGDKPGTLYRLAPEDIEQATGTAVSLHEIGLSENLKILKLINPGLRKVVLLGMQVKDIGQGLELSSEVAEAMPSLLQMVLQEIEKSN